MIHATFLRLAPAAILASLLATGGCARRVRYVEEPTPIVIQTPVSAMMIRNLRASAIHELRVKPCGAPDTAYAPLEGPEIPPGAERAVAIQQFPECADLAAYGAGGDLVGRQADLHVVPGASWKIR